jgi:hypothetical protein
MYNEVNEKIVQVHCKYEYHESGLRFATLKKVTNPKLHSIA